MKKDIHPKYHEDVKITCACGNTIIAGSTSADLKTELCSACHPFFTGKQKLVDTAGRVDKFMARRQAAVTHKKKAAEEKAKLKELKMAAREAKKTKKSVKAPRKKAKA